MKLKIVSHFNTLKMKMGITYRFLFVHVYAYGAELISLNQSSSARDNEWIGGSVMLTALIQVQPRVSTNYFDFTVSHE